MTTYIKFDALPAAGALNSADIVPVEQAGVTSQTTVGALAVASGGVPEAPNDGVAYVRQSETWVPESAGGAVQPLINVNAKTASYTLVIGDFPTDGSITDVQITDASASTLTIPPHSSVAAPVGSQAVVSQWGAGVITVTAGSGVTLVDAFGAATTAQYDSRFIRQVSTDVWQVL